MVQVDPGVTSIVAPVWFVAGPLTVREDDDRLIEPLACAAAQAARSTEPAEVTAAVRAMYRKFGVDPTKTRPSSEALLRRVRKGEPLPRINNLVDVVNWCSLEFQLPYGVYDAGRLSGNVTVRLGGVDEAYAGIRKDTVHLAGRLVVADDAGPFGNPTSDSSRTMVTPEAGSALVVIFAPPEVSRVQVERAAATTRERVAAFCDMR